MVGSTIAAGFRHCHSLRNLPCSAVLDNLNDSGFQLIGPTVRDGAVILDAIRNISELPVGWALEQKAGSSHLLRTHSTDYFGCTVGPHSWKRFLISAAFRSADRASATATAGCLSLAPTILRPLPSLASGRATCMPSPFRMKYSSMGTSEIRTMRTGASAHSSWR